MKNREAAATCGGLGRRLIKRPVYPEDAGSGECKERRADAAAGGGMREEPSVVKASEVGF